MTDTPSVASAPPAPQLAPIPTSSAPPKTKVMDRTPGQPFPNLLDDIGGDSTGGEMAKTTGLRWGRTRRTPPPLLDFSVGCCCVVVFIRHKLGMSVRLSRSLPLPPRSSSREEQKLGIVTVLGCDPGTAARAPSLRRTLSADMSSKKWWAENGFHPSKKATSPFSIEDSSSSDDEEDTLRKDVEGCGGQVYIWKPRRDVESEKPEETWGSILFQKVEDSKSLPPPYVHPMVKRSKSCLSTRSLEICTESLGSETGSDGFSLYPASEVGDMEAEDGPEEHQQDRLSPQAADFDVDEFYMPKYNHARTAEKMRPLSFPPPIQSLATGNGGGSLSMHSRRDSGRLVLEAVSIPLEKNFEARREEGRLVLAFMNNNESYCDDNKDVDEDEDKLVMEMDEEISGEQEEPKEDKEGVVDPASMPKLLSGGGMNIRKLTKPLNKLIATPNRNPNWQGKFRRAYDWEEYEEDHTLLKQSLPLESVVARTLSMPRSVPSTATAPESLNAYEYFWRKKASINTFITSTTQPFSTLKSQSLNISAYAKNLQSHEAHGYVSPLLQSCNSPSRTNHLWEPKCITTS
ncbi:hypothetical protein MLD38_003792 [Melastoma candidum]|uniref:Uncharacterized protein n=1 Tax=Melastoma candidum TaxID=119954 RepID=A0ACB9S3T4_9MYRT|nr:hypothetical protein MLD38_003792 [Melastoma candidum]